MSYPSVSCAASLLTDALCEGRLGSGAACPNGSIVRVAVSCTADVECGASLSLSLLSHLSHNAHLPPDIARVAYVARSGALAVLGYGSCLRAGTMAGLDVDGGRLPDGVVAVGGEAFDGEPASPAGWLVPLLEIRSSAAAWPHVQLAANIHVTSATDDDDNDDDETETGNGWRAQRRRALQLLASLCWSFSYHPAIAARVPPADDADAPPRDTGMNVQQYTAAVDAALEEMRTGTLRKVRLCVERLRSFAFFDGGQTPPPPTPIHPHTHIYRSFTLRARR